MQFYYAPTLEKSESSKVFKYGDYKFSATNKAAKKLDSQTVKNKGRKESLILGGESTGKNKSSLF